jgi:uncharacterized protein YecT (DUF1311 family)
MKTRRYRVPLLLTSIMALATVSCYAQHMNAKDSPCQNLSSNADETACLAAALSHADSELNQLYRRVLTVVAGDQLMKLKVAQRFWVQFRDANCEAEHDLYAGGSAAPMVKLSCLEAVTRHRTQELQVMYGWRLEKWEK